MMSYSILLFRIFFIYWFIHNQIYVDSNDVKSSYSEINKKTDSVS